MNFSICAIYHGVAIHFIRGGTKCILNFYFNLNVFKHEHIF